MCLFIVRYRTHADAIEGSKTMGFDQNMKFLSKDDSSAEQLGFNSIRLTSTPIGESRERDVNHKLGRYQVEQIVT